MSSMRQNKNSKQTLKSAQYRREIQGVTLALTRSPRRVSKVSGERKSSITRPFGEYDFRCQEII